MYGAHTFVSHALQLPHPLLLSKYATKLLSSARQALHARDMPRSVNGQASLLDEARACGWRAYLRTSCRRHRTCLAAAPPPVPLPKYATELPGSSGIVAGRIVAVEQHVLGI